MIDRLRRRRVPSIGDANGWWSLLHIDDAAAATATAVEKGAPGIYNFNAPVTRAPKRNAPPRTSVVVFLRFPRLAAFLEQQPNDHERCHGIDPRCAQGPLRQKPDQHDEGQPPAGDALHGVSAQGPTGERAACAATEAT